MQYVQDYLPGGIEYRQTGTGVKRVESVFHAEGRYYNTNVDASSTIAWRKEYNFKDHLGNTRLVFTDRNANGVVDITGTASTSDVLQENHYYAFGLAFEGAWLQNDAGARDNKYQYNGKELNDDFGLNWNDYGARWYDASVGRWSEGDPLTEHPNQIDKSTYAYAWNNPVNLNDPDGECPICPVLAAAGKGAVGGVAADYGIQVLGNLIEGKDLGKALTDIDTKSFGKSAILGAIGGGVYAVASKIIRFGSKAASKADDVFEITIDAKKYPESAKHLDEAIKAGKKNEGVIDRAGAASRRKENLKGTKTGKDLDRDEAPPAVIKTGEKASVKKIDYSDNRGAGSSIGHQIKDLPNGAKVVIKPKNLE